MRTELLCWFLGISLLCSLLVLVLWACWFFRQWHCLDAALEQFQKEETRNFSVRENFSKAENFSGTESMDCGQLTGTMDVQETRESRLVSDLQQILRRAAWRENEAIYGKQEVMELLSNLSHQLKTPIANIILDIELLESDPAINQMQAFLAHAKAQAYTMQWLLQCLLKASRLENGIIRFQPENARIRPTIAMAMSAVYAQACAKHMEICVKDTSDPLLYHNPKWTAEAMANVLENAVKYAPKASRITIRITNMDIYTRITIQDQGPGIPETEYNHIFQRFYRGKQADLTEGTGLGLYLAQLILQREQGYLTVESKLNQGSRFHFFLLNSK